MNRIRGAIVLGLALLAVSTPAFAQETTGRVIGTVTDKDTGAPMPGVTVIVQGPQGEDATVTDDKGTYRFSNLTVGTYVIRYYAANTSTQVEQPNVTVSAEKTVRVNAKIASSAQAAAAQTYVISGKPPTIDIGSSRLATTFDEKFTLNVPVVPNYGYVITRAPGAFVDGSGNVSIGGATGLENVYIVNGMNVTGLRYGGLEAGRPSIAGGTNLPTEFLTQIDVNAGGYQAEYGGAMGGVINTVLKNGTNEFHGSVWASWAPYWLTASPQVVAVTGSSISSVQKPDFDDRIGFEVGGPLIKDKLFFWAGLAPQITDTHVLRFTSAFQDDGTGTAKVDANGNPIGTLIPANNRRLNETHRTYSYAATVTYLPKPEHKLEFSLMGTPSFNNELRSSFPGADANSLFPGADGKGPTTWPQEALTKTNTDLSAHWTSKFFDRHWQLEGIAGLHNEYFNQRSPDASLNNLNQLQYSGNDLGTLENLPGCEHGANGFVPCPVNPYYFRGGFGTITKSTGTRWSAEIKSTHQFEGGGHHELKYGWHLDLSTFDVDRHYSGPGMGGNTLNWFFPGSDSPYGSVASTNFFRLKQGEYSHDEGLTFPISALSDPAAGRYQDLIHASVKSLSDAFYLQDSWNPWFLRNLTINAGVRYELQSIYDLNGVSFLDSRNLGPRAGAIYDPFNDGRTKISAAYGQFFEAVPLDTAARYFGNENFAQRINIPPSDCANPNFGSWTGQGEAAHCLISPDPGNYNSPTNNAALHQTHIKGQNHHEVVATIERQVMEDMTVRLDYTHRWLGTIIEDGYGQGDGSLTNILANPGHVPAEALADAKASADRLAAAAAADPSNAPLQSQAANAALLLNGLQTLGNAPKPERTYDALSLTVNKRFGKAWFARGSYTYSRLVGNYEGLYQSENNYIAPNGTNAYDTPDLYVNTHGLLANDHPHQGKLDGYWSHDVGPGKVTLGLSFTARSGMPRNYMSNLVPFSSNQIVYLLPRGTAGRTPAITQLDGHIAYSQKVQKDVTLEAYIDLFNVFNERTTMMTDDNYTFDAVAPIENGTKNDLAFAKNFAGAPVAKNANFGRAISYQAPFYSRLGLRLMF